MGQAVLVTESRQYVGYYDADRRLVIASRAGSTGAWDAQVLDTSIGWDSHNYVTMALDASGNLHVAGNMHATKLNYYVTSSPGIVKTLTRVTTLVDPSLESAVTYPQFLTSSTGELFFKFRHGVSGNGDEYIYRFVAPDRQWSLVTPHGLLDGKGKSNAYTSTPVLGPDGYLHMVWMWRDTPDVSTNHSLSYARTKDYVNWENAQGATLSLPLTEATPAVVDPAPVGSGLVNGKVSLGFDSGKRVVITYARLDSAGGNQLFATRPDASANWQRSQITKWSGVFPISGGGSLSFPFSVGQVTPAVNGTLLVNYGCNGSGRTIALDERSLSAISDNPEIPQLIGTPALPPPDANAKLKTNRSTAKSGNSVFVLQWRSLSLNGDKPRAVIPAAEPLLLLEYKAE
ncbi:hypothetical protein QFZ79_002985 [Arthrobacter sp. V4I6]|uniref:BNR repeat-containing protein n=1 Tax=unclassified Arthrobacter TaxID=235627 RepID=UPI0027861BB7|nr:MULTISPECIES: BNR repeat-containing protein [unclassified Arthrobacter]MDQ0820617.1 hypothetical protein [Arthrobacter sp. V1I7]MDQ0854874.1 hypothetical protein [Arthrobacter sp. V4I6]